MSTLVGKGRWHQRGVLQSGNCESIHVFCGTGVTHMRDTYTDLSRLLRRADGKDLAARMRLKHRGAVG